MERAEPAIIFIACSTEFALRSFILTSAIWRSCSCVTLPAPVRPGSFDPLPILAAFFSRKDAGGVFISKLKERSA